MAKLDRLIEELCPNGVEYMELKDLWKRGIKSKTGVRKAQTLKKGDIVCFTSGDSKYYIDEFLVEGNYIFVNDGGVADFKYHEGKAYYTDHVIAISTKKEVVTKYLYYYLQHKKDYINDNLFRGSGIKNLSIVEFGNFPIPLPPLPVQEEIVRILDNFTELTAELTAKLTAELTARKKQYKYYRDELLTFGDEVEWKTLGEIGTIERGNGLKKSDFLDEGFPCIHYGQIYTYYGLSADETISFVSEELAKKLKRVSTGDIIIAVTSENLEDVCKPLVWLGGDDIVTGGHTAIFRHNQNPKYIGYYLQTYMFFKEKRKLAQGTKVIEVTPRKLENVKIPIPPLAQQERIVSILDKFDALVNDISIGLPAEIEARQKQYEYYREKLLSFKELDRKEA